MNLDDIKDQLRERATTVWVQIQETSLYNNLKEKYETLPTTAQKAIAYAAGVLTALIVLSIPYSYISSSGAAIEEFDENRSLLRELLRVGRAAKEPPPLPPGMTVPDLQSRVQGLLQEFTLLPEQLGGFQPLPGRPAGSLAPSIVEQAGIGVLLKKLNLTQVVDIGYRLQTISPGVKLMGLEMNANSDDNHYYDVTYRVVSFSLPSLQDEPDTGANDKTDTDEEQ